MRVVEPQVDIITELHPLKRIELCGRVCYKSEDRITDTSAMGFVENIIKRGHTSVLEHSRVIVHSRRFMELLDCSEKANSVPYGLYSRIPPYLKLDGMEMNARDFIALGGTIDELENLQNASDYMTVRFVCDRAVANEMVRHRSLSYSQESTRYVNYKDGIEFINPVPFEWAEYNTSDPLTRPEYLIDPRYQAWYTLCECAEKSYKKLIAEGCTPQEARTVLPMSTKTELIVTGEIRYWLQLINLRTDKAAHPQIRRLMQLLLLAPAGNEKIKEKLCGGQCS